MAQSKAPKSMNNEKVNQGPSGARKGGVTEGHGQSSDGGGKDDLVPQSPMQHDPYKAKPGDFPVTEVEEFTGQGGPHGKAEGANELASYSVNQCGPRHIEDSGPGSGSGTPTSWESGGRAAGVKSAFPIKVNKGESNQEGGEISIAESINLSTGHIEAKGYSQTRVKEVPEGKAHIPSGR
jgi:hypothetical protein